MLPDSIEGAEKAVRSCTWKRRRVIFFFKRGNLPIVPSQIAIDGVVSNDSIDGAEEALGS